MNFAVKSHGMHLSSEVTRVKIPVYMTTKYIQNQTDATESYWLPHSKPEMYGFLENIYPLEHL